MKMTEKELRKHIKPYLRYAIKCLEENKKDLKKYDIKEYPTGLCNLVNEYALDKCDYHYHDEINRYIKDRLNYARPKGSGTQVFWWAHLHINSIEAQQIRIDFCKLQLKIVKP